MKTRILTSIILFIFLFNASEILAQKKYFFNIGDVKCKEKTAHYYRLITPEGSLFKVTEYFIENNQLRMEGQYRSKKLEYSSREGDFNWYYVNGQKRTEGHYKGGKATGKWIHWYKDGQISSEGEYEKDWKEGEWVFYHRSGAVRSKPMYKEGGIDGQYISLFENGDKKYEYSYNKGKANGEFTTYFEGNIIRAKGSYLKDSLDGNYERYWKNGKLAYKGEYADNKRSGIWEFFHNNGNKSCEVEYSSKGKFIKGSFFDEDGKKLSKKVMLDDLIKEAEYPGGKSDMYKAINEKLGEKLDFRGAKAEKYVIYVRCNLTIDEEGNITKREWAFPDEDDDSFEDKYDVVKYINSAIDDFPKFKPAKTFNRNFEDEVSVIYYIEFAKI